MASHNPMLPPTRHAIRIHAWRAGLLILGCSLPAFRPGPNLTNQRLRFYESAANRPIQREFYDVTIEAGVKLHI